MITLNKISIFPTARCGHKCDYCLLNKEIVSKKSISDEEFNYKLKIVLNILNRDYSTSEVEFLLGDDKQNFSKETIQSINDFSKNKMVTVTMNNVPFEGQLPVFTFKHILSVEDLIKNPLDSKIFVVTKDNINLLTEEIINKCLFSTNFFIDSSIQDEALKKEITERLNHFRIKPLFKSVCLNTMGRVDIFVDQGLLTFSCSKKITHIIGHVDFENKKFVITKTHCDKNCKLI